jgi:hypothetical protein
MLITPQPPAENGQGGFKHGSILDGNFLRAWVNSQWKSTVSNPKDVHVLCYGNEIETMGNLVAELQRNGRRMTIIEATRRAALAVKTAR